jgi:hypothetical protein
MSTLSGDVVLSQSEYWKEIKLIAREAKREARKTKEDVGDLVNAALDRHTWLIYAGYAPFVLFHSHNEDALFDDLGSSTFKSYADAMQQMSYYAMRADIYDELGE